MKTIRFSSAVVLAVAGVLSFPIAGLTEEIICRGTLGAVTVDNVKVPAGATCNLNSTRVQGTVKVESRATLVATTVSVVGNVQAENAKRVVVRSNSVIGGSIQVKQSGSATISSSQITQDLQFDANTAALAANNNRIGGSLQAFQNTGGVTIRSNRINGNLQCKENDPAPTGGRNIVQGSKEDQCASL
jgi:hypothetical protein